MVASWKVVLARSQLMEQAVQARHLSPLGFGHFTSAGSFCSKKEKRSSVIILQKNCLYSCPNNVIFVFSSAIPSK